MRIAFLHTIPGNQPLFEQAAAQAGIAATSHLTRPEFRETPVRAQIHATLQDLAQDADAIIVTCATIGPIVDTIKDAPIPIIRADAALARAAAQAGKRITVLCAVQATIAPNQTLFDRYASQTGSTVIVECIPEAWTLLQSGNTEASLQACGVAANHAFEQGAEVVALAHPWMAPAAQWVTREGRLMHGAQAALQALQ